MMNLWPERKKLLKLILQAIIKIIFDSNTRNRV